MEACAKSIWAKGQTKLDSNSDCATNLAVALKHMTQTLYV